MPRKTRMYLPRVPAHVVQRGNNREACFFAEEDFQFYKEVFSRRVASLRCAIACVLFDDKPCTLVNNAKLHR